MCRPTDFISPQLPARIASLNEVKLGGSDVESIDIRSQAGKRLLGTVRADQGVDLDGVDVVEGLESLLDLGLVGLDIDDKDEGVLLLDLLQGALSVERVNDDLVLIEAGRVGNRLARVLGGARQDEGLGPVEGRGEADLGLLVRVDTLQGGLGSLLGLSALAGLGGAAYPRRASSVKAFA
jgi:hypothetical protein